MRVPCTLCLLGLVPSLYCYGFQIHCPSPLFSDARILTEFAAYASSHACTCNSPRPQQTQTPTSSGVINIGSIRRIRTTLLHAAQAAAAQEQEQAQTQTQAVQSNAQTATSATSTQSIKTAENQQPTTATKVAFRKYHGLGNDFILIDNRDRDTPSLTPRQSVQLCDRNFGVGADGVIFILRSSSKNSSADAAASSSLPSSSSEIQYDYAMRIHNSDGSEPEMCGNGIRCMAQCLMDLGAVQPSYRIETSAGLIIPVMNHDGDSSNVDDPSVTVDMGEPILSAALVPTTLAGNFDLGESVVEQELEANGKIWKVSAVSMGNPHAIIFVDDLERNVDLERDGRAIETSPAFPAKTNVEFVQVLNERHLRMKVWERGAGPTLACGTGACALVVAAMRANKIPRRQEQEQPVRVTLPGGDLFLEWNEEDNKVYMTGPATFAFEGTAVVSS